MPKATINGTTIHYHASGRGMPILFIHPPLITSKIFNYQYVQLSASFRVITFDIRGHGVSAPSNVPLSYPLLVEDMKQLLDYLEIDQACVCGYSTGGQLAIDAMLTHPDRFIGGILVSTLPYVSDWMNHIRIRMATVFSTWLQTPVRIAICLGNADAPQTFRKLYRASSLKHAGDIKQYFRLSRQYDASERLAAVKQPVLLMFGEKDRSFHAYAHRMRQLMPNSTLVFIKDSRHQIPTKFPSKMNGLIKSWISDRLHIELENNEDNVYAGIFSAEDHPLTQEQIQD